MVWNNKKVSTEIVRWTLIASSIIYLYTAGFGLFSDTTQRALHWTFMAVAIFLSVQGKSSTGPRWWDWLLAAAGAGSGIYAILVWPSHIMRTGPASSLDLVMGVIVIGLALMAAKRMTGWALAGTAIGFLAYALWGPYFPGVLGHRGISFTRLVDFLFMTTEGVFGVPMGMSATFIIIFVIFGSFLSAFGAGDWFVDLSYALAGRFRGGPAKTAVVASALMGTISGAPAANVMTTGTLTIPLMKKVGYKPEVAGAIEAVASTGGAFMPPIMGAGAFIMAGYLNIPYRSVAWAALLPSALYYLALLLSVDAQAVRNGLRGLTDDEISGIWSKVWRRMHMAIPVLFLVVAIIVEWSPNKSAFWASILCVVAAASMKSTRPDWKKVLTALHDGSRQAMSIAAACAAAGLIVGVIGMTGLGAKMATAVISLSGGSVFVALLLTMVAAIILGCGMPFTAVYIILAATLAQPLIKLGLPPLAAHMFMFIFSCVAGLTPPVALTAYAAAAVAGAEPNRTGFVAFRLSLSAFIIPFMFAISPSLLLQGSPAAVMQAVISATIGVACLVAALEGYLLWMWSPLARGLLGVAGIALIDPRLMTSLTGLGLIALAAVVQAGVRKSAKPALMAEEFSK